MSDVKQVKVDNWGIYFLQRLKHFFNRTDYCDLTLQFQDNAQLKVHRLVLNACTEYFEVLERTCEMYEDCLVMPEDLQADVVVPIVNFMYTGQLEFKMDALERLYQTSQIMNMPVLSKLLEAHRGNHLKSSAHGFGNVRKYPKGGESSKYSKYATSTPSSSGKRSYTKAFENTNIPVNNKSELRRVPATKKDNKTIPNSDHEVVIYRDKKLYLPLNPHSSKVSDRIPSPIPLDSSLYNKKLVLGEPRPTRYELPEELDTDNVFDNSFTNISYTSKPLMVHPETTKQYSSKKSIHAFNEPTSSKKHFSNTVDIVECKKISDKSDKIFDDDHSQSAPDDDMFHSAFLNTKDASPKDPGQLFDQILDNNESGPKVTIESKDKQTSNLDHAKIISEVLKRYPHLVKSNKNIKLKILNTPSKAKKPRPTSVHVEDIREKQKEVKSEVTYTYETDVLDSKEAAKLISMGAENIKGPWICLICGTPGRALNFTSYFNFRRHLVEVHKEKPVSTICEHCGLKSFKRNYLQHHIYTKHGVPPPPQYHFPKCSLCDYVALTEGFLIKHKLSSHSDAKVAAARCLVCLQTFASTNQLILHKQKTGHKSPSGDKKPNIQCSYCMKVFQRDNNFYCHLKTAHKELAIRDGIIEDSDEEKQSEEKSRMIHELKPIIKHEHSGFENEEEEDEIPIHYEIPKRHDMNMHISKKPRVSANMNQKILNSGYNTQAPKQIQKTKIVSDVGTEFIQEINSPSQSNDGNIVVINDIEYIMKDNQLIPRKTNAKQTTNEEYIISDLIQGNEDSQKLQNLDNMVPTTSMEISNMHSTEIVQQPKMILKKSATLNQPIQIVVSNEEEYKALMASNHSIIFDDGDPSKTLTVLTAPQNTSIDTTGIDLDNTQSNDMMIIQEDYPLNVSEAVSGDNSKYVVVYSHAMDHNDPNKQYQIIAPPDIGAQYVQNSAVITQNYDTITTSTSMVTANVIGTQIQSWTQSDQHNVNNQTAILVAPETELQDITEAQEMNDKQNDDDSDLISLPNAEILRIPSKSTLLQLEQQCNMNQSHTINMETITNIDPQQIVVEENPPNNIEESMNIDIPSEALSVKQDTVSSIHEAQITAEHEIETVCQSDMGVENIPRDERCEESLPEQQPIEASLLIQDQPNESLLTHEQHDTAITVPEQPEMQLPIENSETIMEITSSVDENVTITNVEPEVTPVTEEIPHIQKDSAVEESQLHPNDVKETDVQTREQIQNLASEWSEDEFDNVLEEPESSETQTNSEKKNPVINEEPELEESIENIQHEVQKQISGADDSELVPENFTPQEIDMPNVEESQPLQANTVIINNEETQEKISSLLNDWEDSQEDNTSINENGDDNPGTTDSIESNENESNLPVETDQNDAKSSIDEPQKDNNIKSLVSDWDDDEEENKE